MVTKSGRAFSESLFFGGFRAIAAWGERIPLSPPALQVFNADPRWSLAAITGGTLGCAAEPAFAARQGTLRDRRHRIDGTAVTTFVEDAVIVIAHNSRSPAGPLQLQKTSSFCRPHAEEVQSRLT